MGRVEVIYAKIVLKIFIAEVFLALAGLGLFLLTYFLIRQSPATRPYTYTTFFFLFLSLYSLWVYREGFIDFVQYMRRGDAYVVRTRCTVRSVTGAMAGRLFLGQKYITCQEIPKGRSFQLWFHRGTLFPKPGETYLFIHLPRSRQILEIRTADGQERLWPSTGYTSWLQTLLAVLLLWLFWRLLKALLTRKL